ncbi:unnamed protein product, partial [Allacma fusca]
VPNHTVDLTEDSDDEFLNVDLDTYAPVVIDDDDDDLFATLDIPDPFTVGPNIPDSFAEGPVAVEPVIPDPV